MSSAKLRFRDCELDPDGFELCRAGHRLHLERKPMELLILLAERNGQLVKREEIIEKIWGKDFFFDAENGINNAIRKIRSALNDDSERPRFVETSLGKGYRFIAPVERVPEPGGSSTAAAGVPRERSKVYLWKRAWIPAMAAAALIAAFAFNIAGIRNRAFARGVPPIHSIVVLPLVNLSGDPAQEYFADGMTDALITELAQFGSLRVISRTSAMHYKGSHQPLPEIARELNVEAVVEGSVIRSGDRVRITAQLLEARSDRHLWAKAYERDIREILPLQREVVDSILSEIQPKLKAQASATVNRTRQVDPEAYDDYLRGLYFWNKFTEPGMRRAVEYFEESVKKDPSYALGYAGLAHAYHELASFTGPPRDFMPKSKDAAEKALQLDDTLADAHAARGRVNWIYDWDWPGAEREFRRAIQLNPGQGITHGMYAQYLDSMGRFEEAFRECQIARELDPVALILIDTAGDHFLILRQYDKAIAEFRKALDMDANFVEAHEDLALAYFSKGMKEESITELEQEAIIDGENDLAEAMKIAYARGGYKGALRSQLKYFKNRRSAGSYVSFWDEALVNAQLGNKDLVLQALEKAFSERDGNMVGLNVDPFWDAIRPDPRFQDLVRRVGFPMNSASNPASQ
jgi:TolB-like protein/DNA-binding winged helix-turn-helix (wHTH) protein/Tfp pilus assembly protein PilF